MGRHLQVETDPIARTYLEFVDHLQASADLLADVGFIEIRAFVTITLESKIFPGNLALRQRTLQLGNLLGVTLGYAWRDQIEFFEVVQTSQLRQILALQLRCTQFEHTQLF